MSGLTFQFNPSQLDRFEGTTYELIPLNSVEARDANGRSIGKAPVGSKWRLLPGLSVAEAKEHMRGAACNVGVRLTPTDLVVDVDPRNFPDEDDPFRRLQEDLGISFDDFPTVRTGGGGLHIYMRKPVDVPVREAIPAYPGIEFKAHGRQVVAPGSVHPETKETYRWDPLALGLDEVPDVPTCLLDAISKSANSASPNLAATCSPVELEALLECLDVTEFREHSTWFATMAASHHATGGLGREEFIAWSTGDPIYGNGAAEISKRWDSLAGSRDAAKITAATLFQAVIAAGGGDVVNQVTAQGDFADVDEESDGDRPAERSATLAERYVWIVDGECFVRREDVKRFSAVQFRSFHADEWKEGDIVTAVWRSKLPMRKFESMAYLPWEDEIVTSGRYVGSYNLWRDHSVEPKPGDVGVFIEHMAYLFPDENERECALDYLALLVRRPAAKIKFALLVRGKQGTGKSWLGTLAGRMIGEANVSRPSNAVVVEKYTSWQSGAQLAVIEELMALGRQEVANRLKPVITDDYLCIRSMYENPYTIPNRLNLMCFTNHADALPIEPGDRRWLVLFSPAERESEAYYERLFAFLEGDGPAAVADWLGKRDVRLNPHGVAPMTMGKEEMRSLSKGEAEQYLMELLEQGASPFDFGLVRLEELVEALPERIHRQTKAVRNRVMKWMKDELGAVPHERYKKGGRPAYQLWSINDHEKWEALGAAGRIDAFVDWTTKS